MRVLSGRGYTLTEILIAISILSVVIITIYKFYRSTQTEVFFSGVENEYEADMNAFFDVFSKDLQSASIGYYIDEKFKKRVKDYKLFVNADIFKVVSTTVTSEIIALDYSSLDGVSDSDWPLKLLTFRIVSVENRSAVVQDTELYDWECSLFLNKRKEFGKEYYTLAYKREWKLTDEPSRGNYYKVYRFPVSSFEILFSNKPEENTAFVRMCVISAKEYKGRKFWNRKRCFTGEIGTLVELKNF